MGAEIDRLEVQIETKSTKVNNSLDTLVTKLDKVSGALSHLNSGGLTGLSNGVEKFAQASAHLSSIDSRKFKTMAENIEKLSTFNTHQTYNAASAMKTLSTAINSLGGVSANSVRVAEVANSISKLGGANVQRAITNLPALAVAMNNLMDTLSRAPQVNRNIIDMTNALANLASQGSRVGTVSNSLTQNVNRVGNTMTANTKKIKGFASVIGSLYQKFFWVSRGIDKLWSSMENSMNYVETLNYFDAAFGQVAEVAISQMKNAGEESATAYYDSFSERAKELTSKMTGFNINNDGTLTATGNASLGINPTKLMNYQATFAQMSSSMGVTSETALLLSQALTEIGADLASVKNMDFDKVWTDMASGLAGMSRTLDKYGVNIRNVNLQQKLFELSINENITNLNQNDKALLRTIILLDSTQYAWGDLADTINQPANQMRLLDSNLSNLSRTLGGLFLPAVSKVLPYVNGLVIAMERLFTWVGSLAGIDLSEITSSIGSSEVDMSELLGDTEDLTGNLNDATKAAEKLRKGFGNFDELNVINTTDNTQNASSGLTDGLLDKAFLDSFSEYQKAWDKAFAKMENRANKFADKIEKYFQPIKDIINDFAIGDFFAAGQDASNLASGIFDFFSEAIDKVDWDKVGNEIGVHLKGIEWLKVIKSGLGLTQNISDALAEMWFGALEKAPFETVLGTFLAGLTIWGNPKVILLPVFAFQAGFSVGKEIGKLLFPENETFYSEFKWTGEGGFFDTLKNTDWSILLKALEEMNADIVNNPVYRLLTGSFMFPKGKTSGQIKEEIDIIIDKFNELKDKVGDFFLIEEWTFSGVKDGLTKTFENAIKGIKFVWNAFANRINEALALEIKGFTKDLGILGKIEIPDISINLGKIPTFSTGGFPEDGFFYANHTELVGRFSNGKTAVANNEQIVSGIESGVERAVANVLAPYLADIAQNTRETADKEWGPTERQIYEANKRQTKEYQKRTGEVAPV